MRTERTVNVDFLAESSYASIEDLTQLTGVNLLEWVNSEAGRIGIDNFNAYCHPISVPTITIWAKQVWANPYVTMLFIRDVAPNLYEHFAYIIANNLADAV